MLGSENFTKLFFFLRVKAAPFLNLLRNIEVKAVKVMELYSAKICLIMTLQVIEPLKLSVSYLGF